VFLWVCLQAPNDSSSSGKTNATSLKMLLAKEMANEVESNRSPSVIAKLMGLEEDLPAKESIIRHARSDTPIDSKAVNKSQWKINHQSTRLMTQDLQQFHEYKNVYEVCEDHSGSSFFEDQKNKSDQSDIMQDKFMKLKCFATGEKLPHTKDLQEGLKIPSSNKDFLLGLPEGCNSSLSRHPSRFHTNRAPPQTKHITVLKPVRSAEIGSVRQSQTERVNKQNGLKMGQFDQGASSKEDTPSQSSRIIVLRPTPGKPGISKAKLIPGTTSFQLPKCNNINGLAYEATIGPSGLVHWHDGCRQRDESLLSSAHPSGYVGDESSCGDSEVDQSSGSEIEYIDEAGGSSDSEGDCFPRKHSWNYNRGDEGPYSGSFRDLAHFPESSITREAKKQLSERRATVTCDEICQEKQQSSRRTCTLGEMLSIQEAKIEVCTTRTQSVCTDQSCWMEKDNKIVATSPRNLPRANSAPAVSSMLDNMAANVQLSNPERYKPKLVVVSDKGKLSFKGRVSNFSLSKDKKPRQKSAHHPSACCAERIVHGRLDYDLTGDANKKAVHYGDKVNSYSMQTSTDTSEVCISCQVSRKSDM
jgi:hypothetical protein